jgi:hypothetical protein
MEDQERQDGQTTGDRGSGAAVAQREGSSSTTDAGASPANQQPGGSGGGATEGAFSEEGHRARLLQNYNYDLVQELGELLTGVWRIDEYLKDAGGKCDNCGRIWQDVRKQKEVLVEKIRQEIVNHAKGGQFV